MTAKEGGLPGGDSEMFKELEMQVSSSCKFYCLKIKFKFCHFQNLFNVKSLIFTECYVGDYL